MKGIREISAVSFFLLFLIFLLLFFVSEGYRLLSLLPSGFLRTVFWCLAWSALGATLGLWATRLDTQGPAGAPSHYRNYFVFVWLFAALTALAGFYAFYPSNKLLSYLTSVLIGIVIALQGDELFGKLRKLKWPPWE